MSDWKTERTLSTEQQMKEKEKFTNMLSTGETNGRDLKPELPSLRERITEQRRYAQEESCRYDKLKELEYLLDKHKEIARILDLLDSVRD
jgi:hypothetical protein